MGIPITTTTFEAILAPVYPDGQPIIMRGLSGRDYAAASTAALRFGDRCQTCHPVMRLTIGALETVS